MNGNKRICTEKIYGIWERNEVVEKAKSAKKTLSSYMLKVGGERGG